MERLKVKQVEEKLGVSKVTIYKKIKKLKKQLKEHIIKRNGTTLLTQEAVNIIEKDLNKKRVNSTKDNENNNAKGASKVNSKFTSKLNESLQKMMELQLEKAEKQIDNREEELKRKDKMMNKLIEAQTQERERTDTIIMKLTQDLEQSRKQIENKTASEIKKEETKKTDKVISIKEFVETKVDKKIEKKKIVDPLQGRSALYKIYVKMFYPYKLRKRA
ncbi:HTH domain-containing protein [bacterium]|nr:HTH domain-containing protein [bacterium]